MATLTLKDIINLLYKVGERASAAQWQNFMQEIEVKVYDSRKIGIIQVFNDLQDIVNAWRQIDAEPETPKTLSAICDAFTSMHVDLNKVYNQDSVYEFINLIPKVSLGCTLA